MSPARSWSRACRLAELPDEPEWEANDAFFFGHLIRPVSLWRPPLAHRGAAAPAERLGRLLVEFPGDHGGFLGETTGAFAARAGTRWT